MLEAGTTSLLKARRFRVIMPHNMAPLKGVESWSAVELEYGRAPLDPANTLRCTFLYISLERSKICEIRPPLNSIGLDRRGRKNTG